MIRNLMMDLIWAFVIAMPLSCAFLLVFTAIKARKSSDMEWISSHGTKIRILDKVFLVLFWLSLSAYLLPWIAGLHGLIYGSGETFIDRFRVYGFDAFAHAFTFAGFFGLLIIIPAFLYQVVYLICNRKNNLNVKISIAALILIGTLIMYIICYKHFLSVDIEQFRI